MGISVDGAIARLTQSTKRCNWSKPLTYSSFPAYVCAPQPCFWGHGRPFLLRTGASVHWQGKKFGQRLSLDFAGRQTEGHWGLWGCAGSSADQSPSAGSH
eukprot:scaffold10851_cov26-Prasinocladus_malaysianus.AAC.1